MCLKSRAFCLSLVVLFFLCSGTSWAAVCSEGVDHEEQERDLDELAMILEQLGTINEQQATQIDELEKQQENSDLETSEVVNYLDAAENSWEDERNAMTFKIIASGGIGVLLGGFIYWLVEALGGGRA